MELLLALVWLVVAAAPFVAIISLIRSRRLAERLAAVERRLARLEGLRPAEPATAAPPGRAAPEAAAAAPPEPAARPAAVSPIPRTAAAAPHGLRASLEQRLGGRLSVWAGAAALALAGGFLVKYSVDTGLLGPRVRVLLGMAAGLLMVAAGEWLRPRASRAAEGAVAGGIGVLYASLFAAISLYALIGPGIGFVLLGLLTAGAVGLSLRHGQIVAFIGMAGGFVTPALVGSGESPAGLLFLYLFLLQAGLVAVARQRSWAYLLGATTALALGWGALWLVDAWRPEESLWLSLYLMASAGLSVAATGLPGRRAAMLASFGAWRITSVAIVLATLLQAAALDIGRYRSLDWFWLALLAGLGLVLDRLDPRYRRFAWFAPVVPLCMLAIWPDSAPVSPERFLGTALLLGLFLAGGAGLAGWRAARAGAWFSLAVVSAAADLLMSFAAAPGPSPVRFGVAALVLAAVALGLLVAVRRDAPRWPAPAAADAAETALAVGVTAFVSLAVAFELAEQWTAVAWALQAAAIAWLEPKVRQVRVALPWPAEHRSRLPILRLVALVLAALALVQLLVLFLDLPSIELGRWPWITILYAHVVPLAAIWTAALLFRRREVDAVVLVLETMAVWYGAYVVWVLVATWFRGTAVLETSPGLVENGMLATLLIAYGLLLLALHRRLGLPGLAAGRLIGAAGIAFAIVWPAGIDNPLFREPEIATTPILNGLLWAYGAPSLLAALYGRVIARAGWQTLAPAALVAALFLAFLLVTFEVRHWFEPRMALGYPFGTAENYTYSIVWLGFGLLLMLPGVLLGRPALRQGGLAVITLAVCKVFLFDAANLEGLYRVASFFGLGLSLLAVAFIYQRFVARA